MPDILTDDQSYRLFWLLFRTRDSLWKAREKETMKFGIHGREAAVLFVIQNIDTPATPSLIARWLFKNHNTALGVLRRMEQKGLIKMAKNLDRKNLINVTPTKKGKQAYGKVSKREVIHRMFSTLSERERKQLGSILDKLMDKAISELGIEKPPLI
jgi:DNA-binding MarR family transcriptional regulator